MTKHFPLSIVLSSALVASCASALPSRLGSDCGETGIAESRLLIFGEWHGTNEAPALVAQHVCELAAKGREVVVALEIPGDEQPRLDRFLLGSGGTPEKVNLVAGKFWQNPIQDGRSSAAMLDLIEKIRAIRASGGNVRLAAIDKAVSGLTNGAAMAVAIRAQQSTSTDRRVVVLIGNYHASNPSRSSAAPTTASLLSDLSPTAVLIWSRSGTAWACINGSCGVHPISSKWSADHPSGFHHGVSPLPGYDGTFLMEAMTASLPANPVSR